MTHRVHTILSILAEDHAPAALRPSILLAIDWPTVAEEAPATGDDSYIAYIAAGLLGGKSNRIILASSLGPLASIAARLATVAASLTATGDKAMATHAAALWGAAAALVGMPTAATQAPTNIDPSTAEVYLRALAHKANGLMFGMSSTPAQQAAIIGTVLDKIKAHEFADHEQRRASHDRTIAALNNLATKASDIVPNAKRNTPDEQATLIATAIDRVGGYRADAMNRGKALLTLGWDGASNPQSWAVGYDDGVAVIKTAHDKALADIHALRDILKVPEGGNLVDHADALAKNVAIETARADNATREYVAIAKESTAHRTENARLRAQIDRMIAAMREDAPAPVMPRLQPGDRVPWAEVEDGALYFDLGVSGCCFLACIDARSAWLFGPEDGDITGLLRGTYGSTDRPRKTTYAEAAVLVAHGLGTDPEAWRAAMRQWTANKNRPRHVVIEGPDGKPYSITPR